MEYGTINILTAHSLGLLAGLGLAASAAVAQTYDFDWVTIGDAGNEPYEDNDLGLMDGRGSVGYEYRISRYEVTTGQWMEFVNTFSTQSDDFANFARPVNWGAMIDWDYGGPGRRYKLREVESAEMLPVGGIDWRESAMFVNWLHNGKSSELWAIEDGAYDASTFTTNGNGTFNDQPTHNPDAKFWIPTQDEWLKAAHYDPNRYGEGQGGWWQYPISADSPPVYGPPGEGQANAGFELSGFAEWNIPLGAYPDVQSPWGLLDVAGGAAEWTEEIFHEDWPSTRGFEGSWAGTDLVVAEIKDRASRFGGTLGPGGAGDFAGLRIASLIVPTPGAIWTFGIAAVLWLNTRTRRKT